MPDALGEVDNPFHGWYCPVAASAVVVDQRLTTRQLQEDPAWINPSHLLVVFDGTAQGAVPWQERAGPVQEVITPSGKYVTLWDLKVAQVGD